MNRTARCCCGKLSVTMTGKPDLVCACNCFECQRRTGSVYGMSSYWPKSLLVSIEGDAKLYRRGSDAGRHLDHYFCPACGTTVYWHAEWSPETIGIAVGAFADPGFEMPTVAIYCRNKHPWVKFPDTCTEYMAQD